MSYIRYFSSDYHQKWPRTVMWQDLLLHCVVFTKASEEFPPHYLAEIRHDMRQTTLLASFLIHSWGVEAPEKLPF